MNIINTTQDEALAYLRTIPSGITFIHGKAGCGKTHLIKRITSEIDGCQVLTPTNLAASLYGDAKTIHSYFYGLLDDLEEGYQNPENLDKRTSPISGTRLKGVRMLIIDEISMIRSDLFEMMNQICQKSIGAELPFGGIPIVLVGDLFQLPPIVSDDAVLEYLKQEYGGIYFFDSHIIKKEINNIRMFELTKSFRQANDPHFVELLDKFRCPMSAEDKILVMNEINSRVTKILPNDAVYIASSNEQVRQVNREKLAELSGKTSTIDAEYTIKKKDGTGNITLKHSDLPSDEDIYEIVVPSSYDSQLYFKPGARAVLCKSSKHWGYVNGDFGTIIDFNDEYFTIRLDRNSSVIKCPNPNDRFKANQMIDYRYEMEYDQTKHRLVRKKPYIQKTKQFPLKLAYAFTIHKAQGQTYDKVIIDLNSHIFAPGQLYVALSRAESLQNLFLTKPISYSDIISDDSIFTFLDKVKGSSLSNKHTTTQRRKIGVDSICYNFIHFIDDNESNPSAKDFMLHALNCFDELYGLDEYEKAFWEIQKVVDLIVSTYQVDDFSENIANTKLKNHTKTGCKFTLNTIYEIYREAIKFPHRQCQTENRTITINLS